MFVCCCFDVDHVADVSVDELCYVDGIVADGIIDVDMDGIASDVGIASVVDVDEVDMDGIASDVDVVDVDMLVLMLMMLTC